MSECQHILFRLEESGEEENWELIEVDNEYCSKCGSRL
jgi:hypothetical protein